MSTTIYSIIASRAIRTSSAVECHQEPFSFPSGFSESPTPASAEGASLILCTYYRPGVEVLVRFTQVLQKNESDHILYKFTE